MRGSGPIGKFVYESEGVYSSHHVPAKDEIGVNPWKAGDKILDLLGGRVRPLHRSAVGKTHRDKECALIFVGQKTGRQLFEYSTRGEYAGAVRAT